MSAKKLGYTLMLKALAERQSSVMERGKIALLWGVSLSGATAPRPSGAKWSDGTERVNARAVIMCATLPSGTEWRARAEGKTVTQKIVSRGRSSRRYR